LVEGYLFQGSMNGFESSFFVKPALLMAQLTFWLNADRIQYFQKQCKQLFVIEQRLSIINDENHAI
jgi:hypothetical protein